MRNQRRLGASSHSSPVPVSKAIGIAARVHLRGSSGTGSVDQQLSTEKERLF